jgi:hypothetical protein
VHASLALLWLLACSTKPHNHPTCLLHLLQVNEAALLAAKRILRKHPACPFLYSTPCCPTTSPLSRLLQVNEAALLAAKRGAEAISAEMIDYAYDKVLMIIYICLLAALAAGERGCAAGCQARCRCNLS